MAKKKVTKQIPKKAVKKPVKAAAKKVSKSTPKKISRPDPKKPVKAGVKKAATTPKKSAATPKKSVTPVKKKAIVKPVKKTVAPLKNAVKKETPKKVVAGVKPLQTKTTGKHSTEDIKPKLQTKTNTKSSDSKKSTPMDKKMAKPIERKPIKIIEKEKEPVIKISEKKAAISRDTRISTAELVKKDVKPGKKESLLATLEIKKPVRLYFPEVKPGHEFTIEEKLRALFQLQYIDSQIDKIRIIRGELPMEVSDLEDEVTGLQTRINNYTNEANQISEQITNKKLAIKDSTGLIKKYEGQQMNVKNNREYDSLTKENEFQKLEIQLAEKRIKEFAAELTAKNLILEASQQTLTERSDDLMNKKNELDNIIAETQKEEEDLQKMSKQAEAIIEERLLAAYKNIRENAINGLAVVTISRDACGGCFNKIPPQRQLDIRQHKKVIVCEHCGRILVDASFAE